MKNTVINDYREVFDIEIQELINVKNSLDDKVMEEVIDILNACTGKVVLCGMGKPGHIGRKISATMSSLGIHSYFLHPAEAQHGDMGTLALGDVIIIISNSGETSEVCSMLPNIKMIGIPIIAMTSYRDSTLGKYADYIIELPVMKEVSSLNLAPTSSTTAELVLGDALAVIVSERRKFTKEDFAFYHPAGALGRKLTTMVSDLMHSDDANPVINTGSTLASAIYAMNKGGLGAVSIIDENNTLLGLITDGDLKRYMQDKVDIYKLVVDDVMTKKPIVVRANVLAIEALQLMEKRDKQISILPVVDDDMRVVGMIRNHDIIQLGIF